MGSFSWVHWLFVLVVFPSPGMGAVRAVRNASVLHALLSVYIPIYGFIYFFAGKANEKQVPAEKVISTFD